MSVLDDLRQQDEDGHPATVAYNEALDDVREALRSDKAVTVLRDVATGHALVPNGIVPGSFFKERRKCLVCGEVDDPDHPIRMGLAALAGGDE